MTLPFSQQLFQVSIEAGQDGNIAREEKTQDHCDNSIVGYPT
jgi:hypothetical protein